MLPTAHAAVTILIWKLLYFSGIADDFSLYLALSFGVLIDCDAVIFGSRHRVSPFHTIIPWLLAIIILYAIEFPYFWTPAFAIVHILMDMIDWEAYPFLPLSKRTVGLRLLAKKSKLVPGKDPILSFTKEYLSDWRFLSAEIILVILAIILLLI